MSFRKQEGEIAHSIAELRKLLHSKDVCLVFNFLSRHFEFRKLTLLLNSPLPTFSETSDDLLILMLSTDDKKTKVVPYCGPKEKQTIKFNESGQPHYSSNLPFGYTKYIIENIHQDI